MTQEQCTREAVAFFVERMTDDLEREWEGYSHISPDAAALVLRQLAIWIRDGARWKADA